jgi:hypothetical protein
MKKVKVKKNKKVKIVKNGKVIFEKTADKNWLIETNDEVITT